MEEIQLKTGERNVKLAAILLRYEECNNVRPCKKKMNQITINPHCVILGS